MNAKDILALAQGLTDDEVDQMAYALGWPCTQQIRGGDCFGRVRWTNPYKYHYPASGCDISDLLAAGFVTTAYSTSVQGAPIVWAVTDLGQRVVQTRLQAEILAARATKVAK